MKNRASVFGEFVFDVVFFGFKDAAFGNQERAVGPYCEGGGIVAGVEGLKKGVGGIVESVDMAVVIAIDEFGDAVASESEEPILMVDFNGDRFKKAGGNSSPSGCFFFAIFNSPDITIQCC